MEQKVKTKKILLVDDSVTSRKHLATLLEKEGYAVAEAHNGAEALLKVKETRYDLLLLDLEMPQMSGFELLRTLKAQKLTNGAPILCITNVYSELSVIHTLRELGATGYMNKLSSPQEILFRISTLLHSDNTWRRRADLNR